MKVAVIGSKGFLGSQLKEFFGPEVHGIDIHNRDEMCNEEFDVLINANGNSRRYWANENVIGDFRASTCSVYESIFQFRTRLYIYISSADVYEQPDNQTATTEETVCTDPGRLCPYGFHKYLSEMIVKKYCTKYLILRCSAMVGQDLKKGPIKDILDRKPLFVTKDSLLQFITTSEIAKIVQALIEQDICNQIINIGGIDTVSVESLGHLSGTELSFQPGAYRQVYHMDVSKLAGMFQLKTSKEYVKSVLSG